MTDTKGEVEFSPWVFNQFESVVEDPAVPETLIAWFSDVY